MNRPDTNYVAVGDADVAYQVLGDGTVSPDAERNARLAVVNCPEHAIEVT